MQKNILIILIISLAIMGSSCMTPTTVYNTDSEANAIMFDADKATWIALNPESLAIEKVKEEKFEEKQYFLPPLNSLGQDYTFARSTVLRSGYNMNLAAFDLKNLSYSLKAVSESTCLGDSPNSVLSVESYLQPEKYLLLTEYSKDLELTNTKKMPYDRPMMVPSACLSIDGKWYVLTRSSKANEQKQIGENYILIFDQELNLVDEILLDFGEPLNSIAARNGIFYFANPIAGQGDDMLALPSSDIYSYDPSSKVLEKVVSLKTPYPRDLSYNEAEDELLICHDGSRLNMDACTIYDFETKEETTFSFPLVGKDGVEHRPLFANYHDGAYYFLTYDELLRYDTKTKETIKIDPKDEGFDEASFLIFKKGE